MPSVVVVGGGVAGLAAAWFLHRDCGPNMQVTVLEAAAALGGKLRVSEVAGVPVDTGAESLLANRAEALDLARAVGLGSQIVHPSRPGAGIWSRGVIRPLPTRTVMGVPGSLRALAASRVLGPTEVARVVTDVGRPAQPLRCDVAVGPLVRARMGPAVVDRLVEPMLAGVYAGRADVLSVQATVPALAAQLRLDGHLLRAARRSRPARSQGPVFAGIRGGVGRLPIALAAASGATLRTEAPVRELHRTAAGWRLVLGSAAGPERLAADAVVLALPAQPAARLLARVAPGAAADLAATEYASVAVVTLAWRRDRFPASTPGSGFLVPASEARSVKAVTWSSAKWAWATEAAPGLVLARASVGRHAQAADLQRTDAELVAAVRSDLADTAGIVEVPVDTLVSRWGGGLPQYAVGHVERVARIRRGVAALPGLAVCGAAYDGVGVPACIASAGLAAGRVRAHLGASASGDTEPGSVG